MHGLSLTLPLPTGRNANLPRSLSSSTLPNLFKSKSELDPSKSISNEPPRSASFTSLPRYDLEVRTKEECQSSTSEPIGGIVEGVMQQIESKEDLGAKNEGIIRRRSTLAGTRLWIHKSKTHSEQQNVDKLLTATSTSSAANSSFQSENKSRRLSESLTALARKSWILPSRSQKTMKIDKSSNKEKNMRDSCQKPSNTTTSTCRPFSRPASDNTSIPSKLTFLKVVERPSSMFTGLATLNSTNSSASCSPRSSTESRSTPRTSTEKFPPASNTLSTEKLGDIEREIPCRRDEFWSAFRSLENDFSKFQSKSWSLKTNVVRASLIPFLRNHTGSTSIQNLRPEDLERRINVLNRWWMGLLQVLDGKYHQTVSGVDRPILLQSCYEIMIRPEWRVSLPVPAYGEKTFARSAPRISLAKRCSASLASTTSLPFMIESVNQNIRDLFIQNLMQQIAFVVEKMSLRYAPASLVTFCGKAAAYAFFFVPGVAEILVRIWRLQPEILRRVSDELGVPRRPNKPEFDDIIASFPPHVQCLGWSSVKSMTNLLRTPPSMPATAQKISWYGPWVSRWCGRDSDLFFIFVKYFHILSEDFFPSGLTLEQKARAPGYLLVLAQTLTAIDATIHRQPATDLLPITFDDVLAGADASAATLPLPSNNSARLMAENRLIMLLRDFLSESSSGNERARMAFGQAFVKMMQAAAKRTSLFNHSACFILCDFMEEALNVFSRFPEGNALIDWYFWLDVCQRILKSENTISEIRVFALLYCVWNHIASDKRRKEILCLEWLLTEENFDKYFNHWCPMIRAYYMRLLCWRICRNEGESSDLDTKIFTLVLTRIKTTWAHYLYLKEQAEAKNFLPPSTVPCLPAPGRRLLIIRNDNQSITTPLFIGLDGIVSRNSSRKLTRNTSLAKLRLVEDNSAARPVADSSKSYTINDDSNTTLTKKRFKFIEKLLSLSIFNFDSTGDVHTLTDVPSKTKPSLYRHKITSQVELVESSSISKSLSGVEHDESEKTDWPHTTYRPLSFKFSLEYDSNFERGGKPAGSSSNGNSSTGGPQVSNLNTISLVGSGFCGRRLSPPRLPAPAQAWVSVKVPDTNRGITSQDWHIVDNCSDPNHENTKGLIPNAEKSNQLSPITLHTESLSASQSILTASTNINIKCKKSTVTAIYKGRSLAEWSIVVGECNGFLERRRSEGVPNLKMVEVPTLGVEGLRRF